MDAATSESKFKEANALFAAHRYDDALRVLRELNAAHPGTKNILVPMALCYEGIGNLHKADQLCSELESQFQDKRVQALRQRLHQATSPSAPSLLADIEAGEFPNLLDEDLQRPSPPAYDGGDGDSWNWPKIGLITLGVVLLLLLLLVPLLLYTPSDTPQDTTQPEARWVLDPVAVAIGGTLIAVLVSFALQCCTLYVVLMLLHKLPHDEVKDDFISIAATLLTINLVVLIPLIGIFIALYMLYKAYELGIPGCLLYIVISSVLQVGLSFFLFLAFGTVLAAAGITLEQFGLLLEAPSNLHPMLQMRMA